MRTINIDGGSTLSSMNDLAKQLNSSVVNKEGLCVIKIPEHLGKGKIEFILFSSGLQHIHFNVEFSEEMHFKFNSRVYQPLRFIYTTKGEVQHSLEHHHTPFYVGEFQKIIVVGNYHTHHTLTFPIDQAVEMICLEIDRAKFQQDFDFDFLVLDRELYAVFKDVYAVNTFYHNGTFGLEIYDIIQQIINCKKEGFIRALYIKGLLYNLLTVQLERYSAEISITENTAFMTTQEIELVKEAMHIIENELNDLPTIPQLADRLSTNVNRLQECFKLMYSNTINEHVQELRLQKAKHLFLTTDHNISEVANELGINSRSYFSKIFREKFGVSPSEFLGDTNGFKK